MERTYRRPLDPLGIEPLKTTADEANAIWKPYIEWCGRVEELKKKYPEIVKAYPRCYGNHVAPDEFWHDVDRCDKEGTDCMKFIESRLPEMEERRRLMYAGCTGVVLSAKFRHDLAERWK